MNGVVRHTFQWKAEVWMGVHGSRGNGQADGFTNDARVAVNLRGVCEDELLNALESFSTVGGL